MAFEGGKYGVRRYLFCKHAGINALRAVKHANDLLHCIKRVKSKDICLVLFEMLMPVEHIMKQSDIDWCWLKYANNVTT